MFLVLTFLHWLYNVLWQFPNKVRMKEFLDLSMLKTFASNNKFQKMEFMYIIG